MESFASQEQYISDVLPGSPAARAGLRRGDVLLAVNGEAVCDVVDYEYLSAGSDLRLSFRTLRGDLRAVDIQKEAYEPLGLRFATGLMSDMRRCKNRCVFCFIDQMPRGVRTSLHVKDDDWRMSFIMGNYVSLTNVDDAEMARILSRRAGPLFISLHASDPETRARMMGNPDAGRIMERLEALRDAGIRFHLQIVLCPGLNDGPVLDKTLRDAETLLPAAQSLAIVPVGLTKHREGLYPLRPNSPEDARRLIALSETMQARCLSAFGTRFVFLSDEWYVLAERPLPAYEAYEDFPQIENGVGLLRLFERDVQAALAEKKPLRRRRAFTMAGGESACAFFRWLPARLSDYGIDLSIAPVRNEYFGGGVNVGGLVVGRDLTAQLSGRVKTRTLLIPRAMLKEDEAVFLDGMTLREAEKRLRARIRPVRDGTDMIESMFGR
ncbi:MAG: DUF512 domain-containing protein [Clostridia bacterium]|nr:DUF512 domain-containing protein [Clostridia bacterium]